MTALQIALSGQVGDGLAGEEQQPGRVGGTGCTLKWEERLKRSAHLYVERRAWGNAQAMENTEPRS